MKRLTVALLSATLLLSLSGCDNQDAADLYFTMNNNLQDVSSTHAKFDMTINMEASGQIVPISMNGTIKSLGAVSAAEMEMKASMTVMGQTLDASFYLKDGYTYADAMGMRYKTYTEMPDISLYAAYFEEIMNSPDTIAESTVSPVPGGYELFARLNPETATRLLGEYLDQFMPGLDVTYTVAGADYTAYVGEDKLPKAENIRLDMAMEIQGEKVAMELNMNYEVISYNKITEISFPDDLDSYPEMSAAMTSALAA